VIKLVALDVDGTLLDYNLEIPAVTREAIAEAKARGVQFTLVTGRMYQSTVYLARELGLDQVLLVTYNGAMVREYPSGRVIYHEPVPLETGKALAAYCEARGLYLQAYVDDELYVPEIVPQTQEYVSACRVEAHPVGSLFLWMQQPLTKLLIIEKPATIAAIAGEVRELLGPGVTVTQSWPTYLEVFNSRVSKATGLEAVARILGVKREEVLAMGDEMNDLPMLTWAGTSFAMAHAPEPVRRAATYVTSAGAGEGVAEALKRMGLCG